ncbi:hypothetical protein [Schlesneria sp.]|uniref:hypothetical protein n=1 Tax=Schlesneria sp. TaxID=2762018 RepID=UPI002EE52404
MTEKLTVRLPAVGEFVRTKGRLVNIEDVTPPPPAQVLDYIFENVETKVVAFANGKRLQEFSTFNDFYGPGTGVDNAINEAKNLTEEYGNQVEFRVYKRVYQTRMRPTGEEGFYDRQFFDFAELKSGARWELPVPVTVLVWSSLDPVGTKPSFALGVPDAAGDYRYPDGSAIWKVDGCWVARWADHTPLRGCSPETGMEVDWIFETAEEAARRLYENGEGPALLSVLSQRGSQK